MKQLIAEDGRKLAVNVLTAALVYGFFTAGSGDDKYHWERSERTTNAKGYAVTGVCAACFALLYWSYKHVK